MKVNIIVPFTNLTGGIRVIFLYANYLVDKGYDVRVYVPMKAYKFNNKTVGVIKGSIKNSIIRRTKVEWFNCKFKITLVPFINNKFIRNADVSIATAWPTATDLYNLTSDKGKKIYFVQDYEIWSGKKEEVEATYKLPMKRIVITKELKNILKDKFNVESEIIFNGLDSDEFLCGNKKSNDIKNILMLYNEAPNKGTKEGIEILQEIKKKYNVNIRLFGYKKGDLAPAEFEFLENPSREKLIELYRESDIYVFPSKHEAWGLPVMEAMANKCAVVGNNIGCLKEIATNNVNAIIINNCDYTEMKLQIERILKDDKLIREIQNNGYELAKNFQWNKSFEKFENALR